MTNTENNASLNSVARCPLPVASSPISNHVALTGRVRTYIEHPERGTMPVSCTVYKYDNNLFNILKYLSVGLRGGAGINVILDDFKATPKQNKKFYFYLPDHYPDIQDLTEQQLTRRVPTEYLLSMGLLSDNYIYVNDSMEESRDDGMYVSIQDSWSDFIYCLLSSDEPVVVDLSKIRPKGISNAVGLTSSGAVSFLTIYEAILNHVNQGDLLSFMQMCGQLNEVIRRAGSYKNGIITFSYIYTAQYIINYLNYQLKDLPGSAKKSIRIDENILDSRRLMKLVEVRVNDKSLMLEKTVHRVVNKITDQEEYLIGKTLDVYKYKLLEELYSNVCKEIQIQHTGTCLLAHVNLGQIESFEQIPGAFTETTKLIIDLWQRWKTEVGGRGSQYLSPEKDRQIGIGVIGFANLLARFKIKYVDFVTELENLLEDRPYSVNSHAWELAHYLQLAYVDSAIKGRAAGLLRVFTMAPTQSCAYTHIDLDGNTTAKNINPPLSKRVRRTSHTVETLAGWYYHGDVETMESVISENGTETIQKLWELWQRMMNLTGLAHSMSFDLYWKIDQAWLRNFILYSDLITVYYQFWDKLNQDYMNKSRASIACAIDNPSGCLSCAE